MINSTLTLSRQFKPENTQEEQIHCTIKFLFSAGLLFKLLEHDARLYERRDNNKLVGDTKRKHRELKSLNNKKRNYSCVKSKLTET